MPFLLGADNRACLPSATMSGCSKRCKLGFVKFAQTIFKLITGTLSKGREPGLDPRFLYWCGLAGQSALVRLSVAIPVRVGLRGSWGEIGGWISGLLTTWVLAPSRRAPGQGVQPAVIAWNFGNGFGGVWLIGYRGAEGQNPSQSTRSSLA